MLYEFALLPDLIEEAVTGSSVALQREIIILLKHLRENGMLVDLGNGKWKSYILELLEDADEGYFSEIKSLLNDLSRHNRIVSHPTSSSDSVNWISESIYAKLSCDFNGIITGNNSIDETITMSDYFCLLPPPPAPNWTKWQGMRNKGLRKCEFDFRSALAPILRHADSVHLVDPYFNCHREEYRATFKLCMDLLLRGTSLAPTLVVHAGDPWLDTPRHNQETPKERIRAWKTYLTGLHAERPINFHVFLLSQINQERFHNRYIFTNQSVGINVPYGLDCHALDKAASDSWSLIDVDETLREWAKFTTAPIYKRLARYP